MSNSDELLFEAYPGLGDPEKESIMSVVDDVTARMKVLTKEYKKETLEGVKKAQASPVVQGYPWWNILVYGPYQPNLTSGPQKNMRANDFAFIVGALWMNPIGIGWGPPPSAAQVMGAFDMQINFETINLSTFAAGPPIPSVVMSPIGNAFGPGWLKLFACLLGPGVFPEPAQGRPHKYEMHVTADVSGPVAQPFFAGFSTWMFDPDLEPAIWPPLLMPPAPPHWHFDIPCQFLVYRA